jgi:hypothetical protein
VGNLLRFAWQGDDLDACRLLWTIGRLTASLFEFVKSANDASGLDLVSRKVGAPEIGVSADEAREMKREKGKRPLAGDAIEDFATNEHAALEAVDD